MKKIKFDPINHTYTDSDGRELSGITSIIDTYVLRNKFAYVSEEILRAATERGSTIHGEISMYINGFPPSEPTAEASRFIEHYADKHNIFKSEVLVTDNNGIASSIDIVEENDDNTITLYDIKTGAKDLEKETWQLGIYAYLWELNNDKKVKDLKVIRLQKDRDIEIDDICRISSDCVLSLFGAFYANIPPDEWINPLKQINSEIEPLISEYVKIKKEIVHHEEAIEMYKESLQPLQMEIDAYMHQNGTAKLETIGYSIIRRESSVRTTFDSTKFKAEHSDLYNQYLKQSETKSSITIKFK